MNEPAFALFRHAMDDDIYLKYMDDPDEYWSNRRASAALFDQLAAELDPDAKHKLNVFWDEHIITDSIEVEAAFTAGLAFGLQLSRLL